jgi:hypothetical protein
MSSAASVSWISPSGDSYTPTHCQPNEIAAILNLRVMAEHSLRSRLERPPACQPNSGQSARCLTVTLCAPGRPSLSAQ